MPELIIKYLNLKHVCFRFNDSRITLGRGPGNDLRLPDRQISTAHAQVFRRDKTYFLEDLESANGTFHNNKLIESVVALASGDVIMIGKTELIFNDGESRPPHPG